MHKKGEKENNMMKVSKVSLIVDSVEEAVKFYTEKLGFDVTCLTVKNEAERSLSFTELKKGKFHIMFRVPNVEEYAEFSFIKRCVSRCVGSYVMIKKGLDKYYNRCKKVFCYTKDTACFF